MSLPAPYFLASALLQGLSLLGQPTCFLVGSEQRISCRTPGRATGEAVQGMHSRGSYPELKTAGTTLDFQPLPAQHTCQRQEEVPAPCRTAHTFQVQVVTEQDHMSHTMALHLQQGKHVPACKASQL